MKHSSVRQQLFSLFSAAFRGRRGKEANRLGIAARRLTLGPIWSGRSVPQGPKLTFFKELQQLRAEPRDLRTALRRAQGTMFPEPRHLLADCQLLP